MGEERVRFWDSTVELEHHAGEIAPLSPPSISKRALPYTLLEALFTALVQFVVFDSGNLLPAAGVRVPGEEEAGKMEHEQGILEFGGRGRVEDRMAVDAP